MLGLAPSPDTQPPSPAKLSSDTLTSEALKTSSRILPTVGRDEERSVSVVRGWLILFRADSCIHAGIQVLVGLPDGVLDTLALAHVISNTQHLRGGAVTIPREYHCPGEYPAAAPVDMRNFVLEFDYLTVVCLVDPLVKHLLVRIAIAVYELVLHTYAKD